MMVRKKSPWAYLGYPSSMPSSDFGPMESFVELWRHKCPSDSGFPRWRDFNPLDFEGWWGKVSLAEVHRDPLDLKWVLWGTTITNWWGSDYTNKRISEMPNVEDVWNNYERPYLEKILEERLIGFVAGTLSPQERQFMHICGVDLPLERDGVITHILSAYQLVDKEALFTPDSEPLIKI